MKKIILLVALIMFQFSYLNAQVNACDSVSYTVNPGPLLNVTLNTPGLTNIVDSMDVFWQACNATACYLGYDIYSYFQNIVQTDSVKVCYDLYVYSDTTTYFCNQCDSLLYDGSAWVLFSSGGTTSVEQLDQSLISGFYPNPATDIVRFDYSLNASSELVLIDLLGNKVKKISLSTHGVKEFNISDLSKGIYFGNIIINNKIISIKKLIVK